jgi:osmotically-inducible protein OsmY
MEGPSGGYSVEMWRSDGEDDGMTSELQEAVWEELRWEPELEMCSDRLSVYVTDRAVTLAGTVWRYAQKAAAARAARRVRGVAEVQNEILVQLREAERRGDDVIVEAVRRVLGWDTLVPAERIDVLSRDGTVTLRGEVYRDHQRVAAEQAIEPLVGVTGVVNELTVRPLIVTGELRRQVVAAGHRTHGTHVRVETCGGTVELQGRMASLAEREHLEHAVREIPGVTRVEDRIRIEW